MRPSFLAPWRLLVVGLLSACSSTEPAKTTSVPLDIVVGSGNACAASVRSVRILVARGDAPVLDDVEAIEKPSELPLSRHLDLSSDAPHRVAVTFELQAKSSSSETTLRANLPAGSAGRLALVLPCSCIGVLCPEGSQCTEQPLNSGKTRCALVTTCGDGQCEAGESNEGCPSDCGASCGDGTCDDSESCGSCAADCGTCCGDGACGQGENAALCPQDCPAVCGDGYCSATESSCACSADCGDGCYSSPALRSFCPPEGHWVSSSPVPGCTVEGTFKLRPDGPGRPWYACELGTHALVSSTPDCEGGVPLEFLGMADEGPGNGTVEVFRCSLTMPAGDHVISLDPGCEGAGSLDGSLGFVKLGP